MSTAITFIKGDATNPQAKGFKIIAHVCNDIGGWGKGFVLSISKKWPHVEAAYRKWYHETKGPLLGKILFVIADNNILIANMIAQHGIKTGSKGPPIRYNALEECLVKLGKEAKKLDASIHMPRIGCGLAGGKWDKVQPIIEKTLTDSDVYVYNIGK